MKSKNILVEGALGRMTQQISAAQRIDAYGGSDRKLINIANEIDDIAELVARFAGDPNAKVGKPNEEKMKSAWKLLIQAFRG